MNIKRIVCGIYQRIIQFALRLHPNDGSVFMFHDISDEKHRMAQKEYWTDIDTFVRLIDTMRNNIVSVEHAVNAIEKQTTYVITFDDAYENVYTFAYPYLKRNNIPFTVFVSGEFIGKNGYLSAPELKEMKDSGLCTIGSHLYTHSFARRMTNEQLRTDIEKSKNTISEIIGEDTKYLAFPFGSVYAVSHKNISASKEYFNYVFMTYNSHYCRKNINCKRIVPRVNVNDVVAVKYITQRTGKNRLNNIKETNSI